ncbi:MAG: NAD(P)H-dependent oxidoreductase subunit E [Candidatus Omnitrophota bacterium]
MLKTTRKNIEKEVDKIVDSYDAKITGSISILQDIQSRYNHLPKEALMRMGKRLDMPLSQVFSLATYYKAFTLKPRGKHLISVCMGTACHVRGAPKLANAIQKKLALRSGETTKDGNFTLELVNCLGACALGPLLVIDGKYYSKVDADKIDPILKIYKPASKSAKKKR